MLSMKIQFYFDMLVIRAEYFNGSHRIGKYINGTKWALIHLKWFVAAIIRLFFHSFSHCCRHLLVGTFVDCNNEGQLNNIAMSKKMKWFDKNEITSFRINRKMLCSDTDDLLFRPFTVRTLLLSFQLYDWWCNSSRWCNSCFDAHFPMNVRKTPVESAARWIDDGDYFVVRWTSGKRADWWHKLFQWQLMTVASIHI